MMAFLSTFVQKRHVRGTWGHFRLFKRHNWTEGDGLQIFATFLGAIDAIETLVPGLQICVNIMWVNCSFPYIILYNYCQY